jgi:hypothetical protein
LAVALDLADAKMRSKRQAKGACSPRYSEGLDQALMKSPNFFFGFWIQPHGVLAPAMMEGVEARKSKLERFELPANRFQFFHSFFESLAGPERVDHGDMRHPPTDLLVMFPANSLNRFPTVSRRNDNDCSGVRIITAGHDIRELVFLSKHRSLDATSETCPKDLHSAKSRPPISGTGNLATHAVVRLLLPVFGNYCHPNGYTLFGKAGKEKWAPGILRCL